MLFVMLSCKQMKGLLMEDDVSGANVTLKMEDRVMCLICPAGV